MRPLHRYLLAKNRAARRRRRSFSPAVIALAWLVVLSVSLLMAAAGLVYHYASADLPSPADLAALLDAEQGALRQPTRLYDRSGTRLIAELQPEGIPRRYLPLGEGPGERLDRDLVYIFKTANDLPVELSLSGLFSTEPATLAEKLARDFLLVHEPDGWQKTLRGRLLGARITAAYGPEQVLEWTLNYAWFGRLAYGADTAAQLYFGKPASDLELPEAALLVALIEHPERTPFDNPAAAADLITPVLVRLYEAGAINPLEFAEAQNYPFSFSATPAQANSLARAYTEMALEDLSGRFDRRWLERGGLVIQTALDADLQANLNCLLETHQARLAGTPAPALETCPAAASLAPAGGNPDGGWLASAAVIDNASGQVLALAGDSGPQGEAPVQSGREAGTALTPFVALAGFTQGYGPASLVWDLPEGESNLPLAEYQGPMRLRQALVANRTAAFDRLLRQLGSRQVWHTAAALGLPKLEASADPDNLLHQGGPVTPLELAHAYSLFPNLGMRAGRTETGADLLQPVLVLALRGADGHLWYQAYTSDSRPLLSAPLAYLAHDMLAGARAAADLRLDRPAGVKIGPGGERGAWTVGYTRQLTAAVWAGGEDAQSFSTALWDALLSYASRHHEVQTWEAPSGITRLEVCDPSGLLPTPACPAVVSEVFLAGSEPRQADNLYRQVRVNRETGLLATAFTPPEWVEERTYQILPGEAQDWAAARGLSAPPQEYDTLQPPAPSPDARITAPAMFSAAGGVVSVQGTAAGEGFVSYRLLAGQGLNPAAWMQVGEEGTRPVIDGELAAWNTAGLDGYYTLRLEVLRQDLSLDVAILQLTIDNNPPSARVLFPADGAALPASPDGWLTLQAELEDDLGLAEIRWWLDGKEISHGRDTGGLLPWQLSPGEHTLQVSAVDQAGNETRSEPVRFTIIPAE